MKFKATVVVVGMKASKGTLESGQSYDSTKVYVLTDMDTSKGTALGQGAAEYKLGESSEFEKFRNVPFPFEGEAEMEIVSTGKETRTVVHSIRPIQAAKKAA